MITQLVTGKTRFPPFGEPIPTGSIGGRRLLFPGEGKDRAVFLRRSDVPVITIRAYLETRMETLSCANCGANLPEGSQFCLKCGQALQDMEPGTAIEVPEAEIPEAVVVSSRTLPRAPVWRPQQRKRPRIFLWLLVLLLPLSSWWAASSHIPPAHPFHPT